MVSRIDELLEAAFDSDLRSAADAVRQGKADERLGRFYDAWPEWATQWKAPSLPTGHLRPFAYNNWKGYDGGGLASAWMDLVGRPEGADQLQQQVVRHLLFCDSIAVPDPFLTSADGRTFSPRIAGMVSDGPARRAWAAAAIDSVDRFRELITESIVVVVPAPMKLPRLYQAAAEAMDPSTADLFPPPPEGFWGFRDHEVAAMDIATQLATAGGAMDAYLPTAGHVGVFRQLARAADETIRKAVGGTVPTGHNAILPHVLRCPLPDPEGVSIADVAAIRRDGYFTDWRDAVADGVQKYIVSVGEDPDGWPNSAEVLRRQISAAVVREAERAKASIGWSKSRTVEAGVDLLLVGGSAAAAFLNPFVGAGLAGVEGAKLLAGIAGRWRFARGSFARHVTIFSGDS